MIKNNKIKKLLITLIVFMAAVILKSTFVQAVYFDGFNALLNSHEYYCIERRRCI